MKRGWLASIGVGAGVVLGLLMGILTPSQEVQAQARCQINGEAQITNPHSAGHQNLVFGLGDDVTAGVLTMNNCINHKVKMRVWKDNTWPDSDIMVHETSLVTFRSNENYAAFTFKVGNNDCNFGETCEYYFEIIIENDQGVQVDSDMVDGGHDYDIVINNDNSRTQSWSLRRPAFYSVSTSNYRNCSFDSTDVSIDPEGNVDNFYSNDPTSFYISALPENCNGANIRFSVWVSDALNSNRYPLLSHVGRLFTAPEQPITSDSGDLPRTQYFQAGNIVECDNSECDIRGIVSIHDPESGYIIASAKTDLLKYDVENYPTRSFQPLDYQTGEVIPSGAICVLDNIQIFTIDKNNQTETRLTSPTTITNYEDAEPPQIRMKGDLVNCNGQIKAVGPMVVNNSYKRPDNSTFTLRPPYNLLKIDAVYTLGDANCEDSECKILFWVESEYLQELIETAQKDQETLTEIINSVVNGIRDFFGTGGLIEAFFEDEAARAALEGYASVWGEYIIKYNCENDCDKPWNVSSFTITDQYGDPVALSTNPFVSGYYESIRNSPCYIPPEEDSPNAIGTLKPDCYDLLAPLPGLVAIGVPNNENNQDGINDGLYTTRFSLGFWINRIVQLVTGFVGLFAVIMIIIAGVQYMTTDVIGTKSSAKERIVNALIGLLIALGIFVILNTINPDLINIDPDVEEVNLDFDAVTEVGFTYDASGNRVYNYSSCRNGGPDTSKTPCANPSDCTTFTDNDLPMSTNLRAAGQDHHSFINTTYQKIIGLKNDLVAFNATPPTTTINAVITEAYAPTTLKHCSQCHYDGTCADIALRTNAGGRVTDYDAGTTAQLIDDFIRIARDNGLDAEYELNDRDRYEALIRHSNEYKTNQRAILYVSHVSGEHFSVYDR